MNELRVFYVSSVAVTATLVAVPDGTQTSVTLAETVLTAPAVGSEYLGSIPIDLPPGRYDVLYVSGSNQIGEESIGWFGGSAFSYGAGPAGGAYLDAAGARTAAGPLPGFAALVALDDGTLDALLLAASTDIDVAMPYQGRKYDHRQLLEFPRLPYAPSHYHHYISNFPNCFLPPVVIWDLDPATNTPIVPRFAQMACLYQANYLLLSADQANRIEQIRSGLAAQQIGSGQESYARPADITGVGAFTGLDGRAFRMLARYRIKGGRLL